MENPFFFQIIKHILVGGVATLVDLAVFSFIFWLMPAKLVVKGFSFLLASAIKYFGNKYWVFRQNDILEFKAEVFKFYMVLLIGFLIDLSAFYVLSNWPPAFGLTNGLWLKVCVVISACIAAVWNFLGDKFIVFKK